jgi:rod shape-determining protein MreC
MAFLIKLFSKNGLFLFFFLLQTIGVVLIFERNSMQQSFLAANVNAANSMVTGYIDEGTNYFQLKQINKQLVEQNTYLMQQLYGKNASKLPKFYRVKDTIKGGIIYTFVDGDVIQNSITRKDNYFSINRGYRHGVRPEMGVIGPNGVAGIVINTTKDYALVQSVLNMGKTVLNASIKHSNYFGPLRWKGDDPRIMHLSDIPKYVNLKVGDTIMTDEKSSIYPPGIMIGRVAGFEVDPKTNYWDISVELSQNMGNVKKVFVVRNLKRLALKKIKDSIQND